MLPVFAYITYRVGKVRRVVSGLTQQSLAEVSAITQESLSVSGILLSKTFGQQRASIEKFGRESRRLGDLQIRQQMIGRWFFAMIGTFFSIAPAFVYLLAGSLIIGGDPHVSIGTIVAFTTLQSRLFFPLGQLLSVQVEIQGALALFDRIFEYLEMEPEIRDAPDAVALDPTVRGDALPRRHLPLPAPADAPQSAAAAPTRRGRGRRRRSRRRPPRRAPAAAAIRPFGLTKIDFEALPGQLVALVGPSGAGKTTTTYLIPRLYDVDDGRGRDRRRRRAEDPLESPRREIGVVTQETYLFHASVLENLRYAKPDATMDEIEAAAPRRGDPRAGRWSCRRATTRSSASAATSSRAARSSASRSPASCSRIRASCSSTRRPARSTPCQRATHPGRAGAPHGGPHHDRHRAPPVDHPARRPDPGLRPRPDRRARHARRAAAHEGLYARLYHEQFLTDFDGHCRARPIRPWSRSQPSVPAHDRIDLTFRGGMRFVAETSTTHASITATRPRTGRAEPGRDDRRGTSGLQRDGRHLDRGQEASAIETYSSTRRPPSATSTRRS